MHYKPLSAALCPDTLVELTALPPHHLAGFIEVGAVIYLGGLQPFFTVSKGVEKILVTMF